MIKAFGIAAIMGASAALAASASAQTLASSQGSSACDPIKDNIRGIQCEVDQSIRRTEEAGKETSCTKSIKALIEKGTYSIEAVRAAYGGRSVRETSACEILQKLSRS
jgi:hypothetical protein